MDPLLKGEDMAETALDDLRPLLAAMTEEAELQGMKVCPQLLAFPDRDKTPYPFIVWQGEDTDYLELAVAAGVRVLYAGSLPFNWDDMLSRSLSDHGFWYDDDEDHEDDFDPSPTAEPTILIEGSVSWTLDRLKKRTRAWKERDGELMMVQCVWFADGVAHIWERYADWYDAFGEAVDEIIDEARTINSERRWSANKQTRERIVARALEMAQHPRFRDATSEAKRLHMASQLFPDSVGREAELIAKEAVLRYWWEIEPEIQKANAEKVRRLHDAGEALISIAAAVGMPKEKVKAILLADA